MQKVSRLLLLLPVIFMLASNIPPKDNIKWMTLSELKTVWVKEKKPILIDIYTSWCGWCKVMDKETYNNSKVINYINDHFYAVKFDAETSDSVVLGSKKYGYNPAFNANDLAAYLLNGQMGYPSTVILPSPESVPATLQGYLKPAEIEPPLKYFGEGAYKKQVFQDFMKGFSATW